MGSAFFHSLVFRDSSVSRMTSCDPGPQKPSQSSVAMSDRATKEAKVAKKRKKDAKLKNKLTCWRKGNAKKRESALAEDEKCTTS